jgi:hypothetical protein
MVHFTLQLAYIWSKNRQYPLDKIHTQNLTLHSVLAVSSQTLNKTLTVNKMSALTAKLTFVKILYDYESTQTWSLSPSLPLSLTHKRFIARKKVAGKHNDQ